MLSINYHSSPIHRSHEVIEPPSPAPQRAPQLELANEEIAANVAKPSASVSAADEYQPTDLNIEQRVQRRRTLDHSWMAAVLSLMSKL